MKLGLEIKSGLERALSGELKKATKLEEAETLPSYFVFVFVVIFVPALISEDELLNFKNCCKIASISCVSVRFLLQKLQYLRIGGSILSFWQVLRFWSSWTWSCLIFLAPIVTDLIFVMIS
ncbi:unnamed protein product [Microthlaspi erraticum]|uniref:Uncharacterized protein n=1 Tax=Microthlaspi erraticum TaxID=1685480 RepID=A0A6D2HEU1_9BRAS|nr:unnamed protein product [Microthlaspi erraticum]